MNALWLIAVLSTMRRPPSPIPLAVVMTAPVAAAIGFGLGTLLIERVMRRRETTIGQALLWPFVGCAVGAVLVSPLGRMFVGVGVLAFGTVAVVVRELRRVSHPERR
ncbi:MAG: hypothetical protein ABI565_03465 [Vicinamibacteria bacterium]